MREFSYILTVALLLFGIAADYYLMKPDILLPRKPLTEFPKVIGDWTAVREHTIEGRSMEILQVDDYFIRDYRNSKGEVIGLYIGYFKSQREGKGIHSPRQCLPGAGWVPVNASIFQMPAVGHNPGTVPVNKFIMGKGLDRQLYLFWYHGRGRVYASEYWNKIYLIWDGLTKKRTDGALIRVNNAATKNSDEALQAQIEFINLFFPLLQEYIPN